MFFCESSLVRIVKFAEGWCINVGCIPAEADRAPDGVDFHAVRAHDAQLPGAAPAKTAGFLVFLKGRWKRVVKVYSGRSMVIAVKYRSFSGTF